MDMRLPVCPDMNMSLPVCRNMNMSLPAFSDSLLRREQFPSLVHESQRCTSMNVSLSRHEQFPSLAHESQRLDAQDDDGCWREEVERMQLQLFNQTILWQEKDQGLVSEIHLRDSELTALEHQVRETAKSVEELQKAKDAAE